MDSPSHNFRPILMNEDSFESIGANRGLCDECHNKWTGRGRGLVYRGFEVEPVISLNVEAHGLCGGFATLQSVVTDDHSAVDYVHRILPGEVCRTGREIWRSGTVYLISFNQMSYNEPRRFNPRSLLINRSSRLEITQEFI
ncbi:hypothetical protein KPH14_005798 [Odynerus spinipes]|uniref:Uncharacterized protein n=1 Tax=Odynerus spinipes TaxID=1348599 RepID=A0AAD9VJY0_9HYME|nr:hypothetical protein KPH14_005798 [Odynerus spinipes]